MTVMTRSGPFAILSGYAFLLLAPAAAIRSGLLPFDLRFHALIAVSLLCIVPCVLTGWSLADLGLATRGNRRQWSLALVTTAILMALLVAEAVLAPSSRPAPDWLRFAPFYVLVSSPLQEIMCRAIPRLMAERLGASPSGYVLFSSLLFSLMHSAYGDAALLINTFFAGVAWSMAYLLTANIWPIMASHAAVGLFAFWIGAA